MGPRIREGDQGAAKGRALDGRIIKRKPVGTNPRVLKLISQIV
jgi:hypothetical protein